jgi:hypothetical protein
MLEHGAAVCCPRLRCRSLLIILPAFFTTNLAPVFQAPAASFALPSGKPLFDRFQDRLLEIGMDLQWIEVVARMLVEELQGGVP